MRRCSRRGMPGPLVGDRQLDVAVVGAAAQVDRARASPPYLAAFCSRLSSAWLSMVRSARIGGRSRGTSVASGDVLAQADGLEGAQRGVDHGVHRLGLAVVDHRPRLHAAEVEQAADHHAQPLGLLVEHLQALPALLVGERARLEQRLGEQTDAGQRRLELVRDLGEEVELQLRQVGGALERDHQPDGADQQRDAEGEDQDAEGDVDRGALEDQHQDADDDQRDDRDQHEDRRQPHVAPEAHGGIVTPQGSMVNPGGL